MPSFWDGIKQLIATGSVSFENTTTSSPTVSTSTTKTFGDAIADDWGSSSGSLSNFSQSISNQVVNDKLSGQGTGKISKLSGSTFIDLVKDLHPSSSPVSIKIKLDVGGGQVAASIRTSEGEIVSDTAIPENSGKVTGTTAIIGDRLRFKLESVEGEAINISYQVEFNSL